MLLWSQLFQGWLVSYRPLANFVSHFLALAWAWLAHPGRGKRVKRSSCQHLRVISTIPDARDTWFLKSKVTVAMLRTPRGGRALSRAASGRVPGPSTTDSSLNGIMLMIIFITVLMVASFEHSLLREQRLADGRVVELPNVETVQELERFVETEAKVALRGAAAAAHRIGLNPPRRPRHLRRSSRRPRRHLRNSPRRSQGRHRPRSP